MSLRPWPVAVAALVALASGCTLLPEPDRLTSTREPAEVGTPTRVVLEFGQSGMWADIDHADDVACAWWRPGRRDDAHPMHGHYTTYRNAIPVPHQGAQYHQVAEFPGSLRGTVVVACDGPPGTRLYTLLTHGFVE